MKARRLTKEMVDKYIDVVYVYDAEHIEVKIKATNVMDRTIDKFFVNISGSAQQPTAFKKNNGSTARILLCDYFVFPCILSKNMIYYGKDRTITGGTRWAFT